jgi:hypothetical protein
MRLNYNIYFVVIEQIESVSMRTPSPQFNQELEDLRIEVEDLNVKVTNLQNSVDIKEDENKNLGQ